MIEAGWLGMFLGVVSGAVIGMFFHREDWMGGYDSYRRRLTRLATEYRARMGAIKMAPLTSPSSE